MLIVLVSVLIASCAVLDTIEKSRELTIIDYGKYAEKGFLFTPYIYNGDFESVGPVYYSYSPGAKYRAHERSDTTKIESSTYDKQWFPEYFNLYDAMDDVYNECVKMGADALIETKISGDTRTVPAANPATLPVYIITGFAIKRK